MKDNELDERDGLARDQKSDLIRDAEPVETSDQAVSLQAEPVGTMPYSPAQAGDPAEAATTGGGDRGTGFFQAASRRILTWLYTQLCQSAAARRCAAVNGGGASGKAGGYCLCQ